MNQTEQILLQAIQKSLWNKDIAFPEDTNWDAVLKEAESQSVLGIAIGSAPIDVQEKWKNKEGQNTAHFIRILHCQENLCRLLKENGIQMAILKGTAAAIYYPNPFQRTMGDIDFIIPKDLLESTRELLIRNEFIVDENHTYERHVGFLKDAISFEMHCYFSDDVDIDPYIYEGLKHCKDASIYATSFSMLPRLENGLILLAHMAGHMRTGLGLRQVIDWMMYVNKEVDDNFWNNEFREILVQTGLYTLAITVTKVCQQYLGLSKSITWCEDADNDLCQKLVENLVSSGNFGRKRGSGRQVENAISNLRRGGFLYLQHAGEFNWKAYHAHKWLKPFAWLYQMGRYIKQGVQTKRSHDQIMEDFKRGKTRSQLYDLLKIGKE